MVISDLLIAGIITGIIAPIIGWLISRRQTKAITGKTEAEASKYYTEASMMMVERISRERDEAEARRNEALLEVERLRALLASKD